MCFQERLRRSLLVPRLEFSDEEVSNLVTALSASRSTSGLARLSVCFTASLRLALCPFPGFLCARPRLVRVLFPGPLLFGTWAFA
jgi:hypothetical protein